MVLICFYFGVYFNTAYLTLVLLAAVEVWRWEFIQKSLCRSQLQHIYSKHIAYLFNVYYDLYNDNVPSIDTVVSHGRRLMNSELEKIGKYSWPHFSHFPRGACRCQDLVQLYVTRWTRFRAWFCFIHIILPDFVTLTVPFSSSKSVPGIYLNPLFHSRFPGP